MAALQRSSKSFRRQGSSGSVWDGKLAEELNKLTQSEAKMVELRHCRSIGGGGGGMSLHDEANSAPAVYTRSFSTPSTKAPVLESVGNGFAGAGTYEHEEKPKL